MNTQAETGERHEKTVRALLLALLRFAVTNDNDDRLTVLAAASQIDKLNAPQGHPDGFRFFHRTSAELCLAITEPHSGSAAMLRRHLERMTDERMKRAFAAAVDLDQVKEPANPRSRAPGLWRGLTAPPRMEKLSRNYSIL
jgi:hypothetical protein